MSVRQATLVVLLVAVGAALVIAPAAGSTDSGGATGPAQVDATNETNESSSEGVSLGTQISSFMQASSAQANGSVDAGMWKAEFNASDGSKKTAVVEHRIETLERRQDRLEARLADLEAKHENGTLPEVAYLAQATHLTGKIDSLQGAINDTETAATSVGVNDTRLERLRTEASNMSGRQAAQAARRLPVVSSAGLGHRGPPEHAGPPANPGNQENGGPPADGAKPGRPDDAGNGAAGPQTNGTAADNASEQGRSNQGSGQGPDGAQANDGRNRDGEQTDGSSADDSQAGGNTGKTSGDDGSGTGSGSDGSSSSGGGSGGNSGGGNSRGR